jgi:hypothetical protein
MNQRMTLLTCKCLGCRTEITKPVSWFKKVNFKCPHCDGLIDETPLKELSTHGAASLKAEVRRPDTTEPTKGTA